MGFVPSNFNTLCFMQSHWQRMRILAGCFEVLHAGFGRFLNNNDREAICSTLASTCRWWTNCSIGFFESSNPKALRAPQLDQTCQRAHCWNSSRQPPSATLLLPGPIPKLITGLASLEKNCGQCAWKAAVPRPCLSAQFSLICAVQCLSPTKVPLQQGLYLANGGWQGSITTCQARYFENGFKHVGAVLKQRITAFGSNLPSGPQRFSIPNSQILKLP